MSIVYSFEGKIVKFAHNRYIIYLPKGYQEKLKKYHGRRIKVIVIIEPD